MGPTQIKPFEFTPSPYKNRASRRADAVRHRKALREYNVKLGALRDRRAASAVKAQHIADSVTWLVPEAA